MKLYFGTSADKLYEGVFEEGVIWKYSFMKLYRIRLGPETDCVHIKITLTLKHSFYSLVLEMAYCLTKVHLYF